MFAKKLWHFCPSSLLLVSLLLFAGCASLKPNASHIPPEEVGGLAISDEARNALGFGGTWLYFIGQFFAASSYQN
jgi:hypothetical protein